MVSQRHFTFRTGSGEDVGVVGGTGCYHFERVALHDLLSWSEGHQQIPVRRTEEWLAQQLSFVASVGRHLEQLVIPGSAWSVGKTAFASMQRGQRGNLTSIFMA